MPLNLTIEIMVAVLLTTTIFYCYRLNKKLVALRADEENLMGTIAELVEATEVAERAVGSMRQVAAETQQDVVGHLNEAYEANSTLQSEIRSAQALLDQLHNATLAETPAATATPAAQSARLQAEESARRLEALRAMRKQAA